MQIIILDIAKPHVLQVSMLITVQVFAWLNALLLQITIVIIKSVIIPVLPPVLKFLPKIFQEVACKLAPLVVSLIPSIEDVWSYAVIFNSLTQVLLQFVSPSVLLPFMDITPPNHAFLLVPLGPLAKTLHVCAYKDVQQPHLLIAI